MSTATSRLTKGRRSTSDSAPEAVAYPAPTALPTAEAARYTGLSPGTLKKWRVTGDGPAYVRVGSRIVYLVEDLDFWLHEHRIS